MATSHSMSKARLRRKISRKSQCTPNDRKSAPRIDTRLRQFLDSEHAILLKTQSLLQCIAKSMDDTSHPPTGPYYPDVIELASDLIRRRATNIDQLLRDGRLPE